MAIYGWFFNHPPKLEFYVVGTTGIKISLFLLFPGFLIYVKLRYSERVPKILFWYLGFAIVGGWCALLTQTLMNYESGYYQLFTKHLGEVISFEERVKYHNFVAIMLIVVFFLISIGIYGMLSLGICTSRKE